MSYHVEVDNTARGDATQLTITGPDVPGLLAAMTVRRMRRCEGCKGRHLHSVRFCFILTYCIPLGSIVVEGMLVGGVAR